MLSQENLNTFEKQKKPLVKRAIRKFCISEDGIGGPVQEPDLARFKFSTFFIKHFRQKRHLLNLFSRKCQVQNDRTTQQKIVCFGQKLDFTMYFTIKTSIFKL